MSATRAVGIDYGTARIGLAASDALGVLAHPVETLPATPQLEALERIANLVSERHAEFVVIGLPLRQDGTEGRAAQKVQRFAAALRPLLPDRCIVHFQDEYRSTEEAKLRLRESGKRERRQKPVIDQAAAAVILQEFLDWHNGPRLIALDDQSAGEGADLQP
ncbi:MAG: Holliday junction resolvase RuvX [Verrucomicrobiales bacterium]|nr:Holliday junction resolvase RuvX [Verrucomicrobiales bacterium]